MIRLPHDKRTRIQLALVFVFLFAFYFGVRYVANWMDEGHHFLELKQAIVQGDAVALVQKLDAGINVDAHSPDGGGETPLHTAASHSSAQRAEEMARILLDRGAKPDAVDFDSETPMHHAVVHGHLEVVRLLVENGAPLHARSMGEFIGWEGTPALVALLNEHVDVAKYILLEAGKGDLREEDLEMLLAGAALVGDAELIRKVVDAGANPDARVELQVGRYSELIPLNSAVRSGSVEAVEALLALGASPAIAPPAGEPPMIIAAAWQDHPVNSQLVRLLLEAGVEIESSDRSGTTVLHYAALAVGSEMVQLLLDRGADVNARTNGGETPLFWAVAKGNIDVLKLLLKHGGDISIPNQQGFLPIDSARRMVKNTDHEHAPPNRHAEAMAVLKLLERHTSEKESGTVTSPVTSVRNSEEL